LSISLTPPGRVLKPWTSQGSLLRAVDWRTVTPRWVRVVQPFAVGSFAGDFGMEAVGCDGLDLARFDGDDLEVATIL
jgi:hypothetical protein